LAANHYQTEAKQDMFIACSVNSHAPHVHR
jgi:hypothetical protein